MEYMADVKWDAPLTKEQRANPVVYSAKIDLPSMIKIPTDSELEIIFKTKGYKLQTWGRSKDERGKEIKTNENPKVNNIKGIKFIFFFSSNSFKDIPEIKEI